MGYSPEQKNRRVIHKTSATDWLFLISNVYILVVCSIVLWLVPEVVLVGVPLLFSLQCVQYIRARGTELRDFGPLVH